MPSIIHSGKEFKSLRKAFQGVNQKDDNSITNSLRRHYHKSRMKALKKLKRRHHNIERNRHNDNWTDRPDYNEKGEPNE